MITLPESFVALKKYPGYYWCEKSKKLHTLKVTGVLKPLTKQYSNGTFRSGFSYIGYYYSISHKGIRKSIFLNGIDNIQEKYLDRTIKQVPRI